MPSPRSRQVDSLIHTNLAESARKAVVIYAKRQRRRKFMWNATMRRPIILSHVVVLAITIALVPLPTTAQTAAIPDGGTGPRFRADGLDADVYGRKEGYPSCTGLTYLRDQRCRVGAFSNFDKLYPSRVVAASKAPGQLRRAEIEPSIRYSYAGQSRTLEQYLDTYPVTGLLIAKGDSILVERYQYGRTDKDRFTSFSMAKSIVGLLIGIAVKEGAIRSIDDLAEVYVPGLKGTEYGRTPIKAFLQMASGVSFRESYSDTTSDIYTLANLTLGQDPGGSISAVKRFNTRYAESGTRYSYSSADTVVLGLVLAGATQRKVSEYASAKLWVPLGSEADATWIVDATGQEIAFSYVNAVLRDWARLGLMLAHDGTWQGKSIIPRDWLLASTSIEPGSPLWSSSMEPGAHAAGYGYQFWLLPSVHRTFAMRGIRGQFVLVDPERKLVLVQTALAGDDATAQELYALWAALASQPR
jgi:CubicO group peptidase (beta-lactamase class C family)